MSLRVSRVTPVSHLRAGYGPDRLSGSTGAAGRLDLEKRLLGDVLWGEDGDDVSWRSVADERRRTVDTYRQVEAVILESQRQQVLGPQYRHHDIGNKRLMPGHALPRANREVGRVIDPPATPAVGDVECRGPARWPGLDHGVGQPQGEGEERRA